MAKKMFAVTIRVLAVSSIFRKLAKMKEFKEDEGELFALLSVLHSGRGRRNHARIQGFVEETV